MKKIMKELLSKCRTPFNNTSHRQLDISLLRVFREKHKKKPTVFNEEKSKENTEKHLTWSGLPVLRPLAPSTIAENRLDHRQDRFLCADATSSLKPTVEHLTAAIP